RFLVADPAEHHQIDWGKVNQAIDPGVFDRLLERIGAWLQGRELFVCDAHACAQPGHRLPVRVIADAAWHALFARCLFRQPSGPGRFGFPPGADATGPAPLTVLGARGFRAEPARDGTRSETVIVLHLPRRLILVAGTIYAGEIKKGVFSYLNYLLPGR